MRYIFMATLLALAILPSYAQEDPAWKQEMERKLDTLTREIEKMKMGTEAAEPVYESKHGFAPAAAKVYHVNRGVSIGGYGEMTVQDFSGKAEDGTVSGKKREADFLRAIIYTGYKFTDTILFNSELEFEHASTAGGHGARGEVSVEFAYLDFMLARKLGIRAGMVLVPMGFLNELHEPTIFHGVRRPNVETNIIPTTWRENGAGLFGEAAGLSWRSYVVTGLQAVKDADIIATTVKGPVQGFSSSAAIRNGRSKGAKSQAEDVAWVSRVDYKAIPGLLVGGSYYTGRAGQNNLNSLNQEIDAAVSLQEAHAQAEYKGLELRGIYAHGRIGQVADLNSKNGLTGTNSIGERFFGGYIQAAFDVLSLCGSKQYLAPFVRVERYNTQSRVPSGFAVNPANSRKETTYGLTYKPHPNTVIKGDWQDMKNEAKTGVDQFNLGIGYLF